MKQHKQKMQLLQFVPISQQSAKQKAFRYVKTKGYLHKLTRDPKHLDELDWQQMRGSVAMWRKTNATLICISESNVKRYYSEKHVSFTIQRDGITYQFVIYGKSHDVIAETLAFFLSLQPLGDIPRDAGTLSIEDVVGFDFAALSTKQLARILDANPTRTFALRTGTWNAAQSVILATRPYPLNLSLGVTSAGAFAFSDGGKAFADTLETRKASFGSLRMTFPVKMPFSHDKLQRLFELKDTFEKLVLGPLNNAETVLLPFSAQVKALDYEIHSRMMQPGDFDSLHIATKDLHLKLHLEHAWDALPISFLNRVSVLGHLERLGVSMITSRQHRIEEGVPLAEALIRAMVGNPRLTYLNLGETKGSFDWTPHLQSIFEAMEVHPGLRTFLVDIHTGNNVPYALLKKLISRNRNIVVVDSSGSTYSNGSIAKIYSLNRVYRGSGKLVRASASSRPQLVVTALAESASNSFQCAALVGGQHTDMLCEFVDDFDCEMLQKN